MAIAEYSIVGVHPSRPADTSPEHHSYLSKSGRGYRVASVSRVAPRLAYGRGQAGGFVPRRSAYFPLHYFDLPDTPRLGCAGFRAAFVRGRRTALYQRDAVQERHHSAYL